MQLKSGDRLAHTHIRGLVVEVLSVHGEIEQYWCKRTYTLPGEDLDPETQSVDDAMYHREDLEGSKFILLDDVNPPKDKEYTYKYGIGDYFITKIENLPFRVVSMFDGHYLIQMFVGGTKPLFFVLEDVLDESGPVPLLPVAVGQEGLDK